MDEGNIVGYEKHVLYLGEDQRREKVRRIVDTNVDDVHDSPTSEQPTLSNFRSNSSTIGTSETDLPPLNIPMNTIHINQTSGHPKTGPQSPLNSIRGLPLPQTNRGTGNLDAFVTRGQQNPSV